MELELKGKVAVVTGASRGIGAEIARELAREGCDLVLAARSRDELQGVADDISAMGRRALVHVADLRETEAPGRLASAAADAFGRLDILVNNAGATKRGDFLTLTDSDWQDGFALKFFAHLKLTRAAWPHLQASGGSVLFISGIGGRTPGAEFAIGGSVNAALLSLAKALADKGIADGIQVNVVNPGAIATGRLTTRIRARAAELGIGDDEARRQMVAEFGIPRFGEPADIAGLVAFAVSGRGRFLHGALIDMDGGQTKTL